MTIQEIKRLTGKYGIEVKELGDMNLALYRDDCHLSTQEAKDLLQEESNVVAFTQVKDVVIAHLI